MDQHRAFPFRLDPEQASRMSVSDFFNTLIQEGVALLDEEVEPEPTLPTIGGEVIRIPGSVQVNFAALDEINKSLPLDAAHITGLLLDGLENAIGHHLNDLAALLHNEPESATRTLGMWLCQLWLEHIHSIGTLMESAYSLAVHAWDHSSPIPTRQMQEYANQAKDRLSPHE